MIWLLSRLWAFGLVALVAGFALTWFTMVQKRTVRARITVDRVHAAHARSGSTTMVGSLLDELREEDPTPSASSKRTAPRVVGTALSPRTANGSSRVTEEESDH